MTRTLLSIVIPTRDRCHFLERCLHFCGEVLDTGQWEVIIIDDGSSPDHAQRNAQCARQFSNCHYEHSQRSRGGAAARNRGMALSRGSFIWFIDDDDYASTKTLEDVLLAVRRPDLSDRILLLPMNVVTGETRLLQVKPREDSLHYERVRRVGHEVSTSCVIFPRSVLDAVAGWDASLWAGQDTDLFLRVSRVADCCCLDTEGVQVDWGHSGRITRSIFRQEIAKIQILKKHWRHLSLRRNLHYLISFLLFTPCAYGLKVRFQEWGSKRLSLRRKGREAVPDNAPSAVGSGRLLLSQRTKSGPEFHSVPCPNNDFPETARLP